MKKIQVALSASAGILALLAGLVPQKTSAAQYPSGTMVSCPRSYRVDYVAPDGRRYPFANAAVYYTWYQNFRDLKRISCAEFDAIQDGGSFVTARPGLRLLKFHDSADVYALAAGGELRKIGSPAVAQAIYGARWGAYIIAQPPSARAMYRLGAPITAAREYDKLSHMNAAKSVEDELRLRGVLANTAEPPRDDKSSDAALRSLTTNLSEPIPFNPSRFVYDISAPAEATHLLVSAWRNHPRASVTINNQPAADGAPARQALLPGPNISTIVVTAEDGQTVKRYYVRVTRPNTQLTDPIPAPPPEAPPSAGAGDASLSSIVSEETFNAMFPNRSYSACTSKNLFSYQAFITAAESFPLFAGEGSLEIKKREVAAFLAQISHETTGGWATAPGGPYAWGLCFKEEVGCERGGCAAYCDQYSQYQCVPGKGYHGRGPIQLSWNYNYGAAGAALGLALLQHPELLTTDGVASFKSALWFWMTAQPPKPSAHDVMTGKWQPTAADTAAGRRPGFGMTTNIINGGIECQQPTGPQVRDRVGFFRAYAERFGVSAGDNLFCDQMRHY